MVVKDICEGKLDDRVENTNEDTTEESDHDDKNDSENRNDSDNERLENNNPGEEECSDKEPEAVDLMR